MTDGKRIDIWLKEYQRQQRLRDLEERALQLELTKKNPDVERIRFLKSVISDCEHHMRSLRERLEVYWNY